MAGGGSEYGDITFAQVYTGTPGADGKPTESCVQRDLKSFVLYSGYPISEHSLLVYLRTGYPQAASGSGLCVEFSTSLPPVISTSDEYEVGKIMTSGGHIEMYAVNDMGYHALIDSSESDYKVLSTGMHQLSFKVPNIPKGTDNGIVYVYAVPATS